MIDTLRTVLHRALVSEQGDGFAPVRLQKEVWRRINRMLGSPLCSSEDLARRRAARGRLKALRAEGQKSTSSRADGPAPVVVYFEKNRNQRLLDRVEEALRARGIPYRALDVTGDEATVDWVTRTAQCQQDDLPVVFVAGSAIGGYGALVEWDVSGRLKEAVFGRA